MAAAHPGRAAYEAYRDATGGKSLVSGDPLPEFDGLSDAIQAAWKTAADAARVAPAEREEVGADGRIGLKLRRPIEHAGEQLSELRFRKAKAKDLRGLPLEGRNVGHILDIVGKLCGQPSVVVDELGAEDLQEVSSLAGVF